ncbi:MAG: LysM peptidoglycan-binding domain-containing protein, partial [Desulfobacterales bacterium]|nr:LysM peptidoglycan-binding domain-containing protein [Desulfobacterales bacterium]
GHHVTAGNHALAIPSGSAKGFHARFVQFRDQWLAGRKLSTYVVQRGDNLSIIAKRFNVPLPSLFIWNRLPINGVIHPGDRLVIFTGDDDKKEN